MQHTSLYENHKKLNAKMISFGGWEMPRDYGTGTAAEVKNCRTTAGLFDVSHMGEFRVIGPESLDFIQHLISNDASKLTPGKAQYSLLLNEKGGVKDDIIVYCAGPENFMIVVNAGCKDKDWDWFSHQIRSFRAELTDESAATALIAVQGPSANGIVQRLSTADISGLRRFEFTHSAISGIGTIVSKTGYTGEDGCELFCSWNDAPALWDTILEAGAQPCGLASRDVLRLEAGYPLYGHELNEDESPVGLGLSWAIKTYKADFIGRNDIVRRSQDGIRDKLVGLSLATPNAIPREGQLVFSPALDDPIGRVTSGTLSPMLNKGIAMAKIGAGHAAVNTTLQIDIRGRRADAVVTKLPFYRGLDN